MPQTPPIFRAFFTRLARAMAVCGRPRDESGSIAILLLMLIPAIVLIGGIGTDICLINAQKKYVQSQSDLAAQSAARVLPDLALARQSAQRVVSANDAYGQVTLARGDVVFGSYVAGSFIPAADQTSATGVNAVRVSVASPYTPLLLRPVMSSGLTVSRSATARQRAAIAFGLRNSLLTLDTSDSILEGVLRGLLGVDISAGVLDTSGVLGLGVDVNKLLGLVSLDVAGEVLNYQDILGLGIGTPVIVQALSALGVLPAGTTTVSNATLSLGSLLSLSPSAANVEIGQILPNLSLNAFDLLMAVASLNGTLGNGLVSVPLSLSIPYIAELNLSLGIVHSAVMAAGFIDDVPPVTATVSQLSLNLGAKLVSFITLDLGVSGAQATATATGLNCAATRPGDTLATFDVRTAPVALRLALTVPGVIDGSTRGASDDIALFGGRQVVSVLLGELGQPVSVETPIRLTGLTSFVSGLLSNLSSSLKSDKSQCGFLGLGCLLDVVNWVIDGLSSLIAGTFLNDLVDTLLDALGIELAPAELTVSDYSCSSQLVQ
ncbi:pilus assembly protein TadG-related protein [Paenirhodobacter enshiensis]|uniref:Putative Flp pilus-assembly TadG-like N-terminal domain-containing protein n=1 Tax=Paenirhodobacter enshiensis TaxID=1105367 RepID=A0A086XRE3_9RHOB|nr:hypothetical protein [Paenirhodobacter enshiensis]KFI24593.1 hypothetical protein CG50_09720 [Paenirhodobacter enshiensis]